MITELPKNCCKLRIRDRSDLWENIINFATTHHLIKNTDIGYLGMSFKNNKFYRRFWIRDPSMAVLAKLWM